jgi:hypothetical protein
MNLESRVIGVAVLHGATSLARLRVLRGRQRPDRHYSCVGRDNGLKLHGENERGCEHGRFSGAEVAERTPPVAASVPVRVQTPRNRATLIGITTEDLETNDRL